MTFSAESKSWVLGAVLMASCSSLTAAELRVMKEDYGQFHYNTDLQSQATAIDLEDETTQRVRQILEQVGVDYSIQMRTWPISYRRASERPGYGIFPLERNDDLEKTFEFIGPLAEYQWVVYTRASSDRVINSLDDLQGMRVGGYQNSPITEYLTEQGVTVDELPYDALNLKKLTLGYIDAWVTYNVNAESIARQAGYPMPRAAWVVKTVDVYLGINKESEAELLTSLGEASQWF